MAAAAADAAREGWADWLSGVNTPQSLARAAKLDPGNASLHALLAEHQEGLGGDPKPELQTAATLSPREARYWARLAFRAETEKNDDQAEKYLLRAADVDRMFTPRWALANFYLRRGDTQRGDIDQFWNWLTRSIDMAPDEPGAIFQVAWAVARDGRKVRSVLPAKPEVLREYVRWLVGTQAVTEASAPARELAQKAGPAEVDILLDYINHAIEADSDAALEVWNELCRSKLLPFSQLNPRTGPVVTDGAFAHDPLPRGFGWTMERQGGISQNLTADGSGVVVQFSGKEAETAALLMQRIPLAAGQRYRLRYEYRVAGNNWKNGLSWRILNQPADGDLLEGREPLGSADRWQTATAEFHSAKTYAPRLMLYYQRQPGMVPWEGAVYIRKVDIEAVR